MYFEPSKVRRREVVSHHIFKIFSLAMSIDQAVIMRIILNTIHTYHAKQSSKITRNPSILKGNEQL